MGALPMGAPRASPVFGGLEGREPLGGSAESPSRAPATGDEPPAGAEGGPPWYRLLFSIPPTPGMWLGLAGLVLIVLASALPWYTVSARFETAGYPDMTPILQFDGINGLFVHPDLKANLGLTPPAVGFPVALLFVVSSFLKVRKLVRSASHKMRAGTLVRGSLVVLLPLAATVLAVGLGALLVPADAPTEVHDLVGTVSGQPLGGAAQFTLDTPSAPAQPGSLEWGFGPALWVMAAAALIMNVGSRMEVHSARRAQRALREAQGGGTE